MAIKYTYPPQRKFPALKGNKYGARKAERDGITFDSTAERDRYDELKLLLRAGRITDLRLQVPYELIPRQRGADGKEIEKPCKYFADFVYLDQNGVEIVEDVKGCKKSEAYDLFVIKRKLMLQRYGIRVKEV